MRGSVADAGREREHQFDWIGFPMRAAELVGLCEGGRDEEEEKENDEEEG